MKKLLNPNKITFCIPLAILKKLAISKFSNPLSHAKEQLNFVKKIELSEIERERMNKEERDHFMAAKKRGANVDSEMLDAAKQNVDNMAKNRGLGCFFVHF